jgi:hypothetical protein
MKSGKEETGREIMTALPVTLKPEGSAGRGMWRKTWAAF